MLLAHGQLGFHDGGIEFWWRWRVEGIKSHSNPQTAVWQRQRQWSGQSRLVNRSRVNQLREIHLHGYTFECKRNAQYSRNTQSPQRSSKWAEFQSWDVAYVVLGI